MGIIVRNMNMSNFSHVRLGNDNKFRYSSLNEYNIYMNHGNSFGGSYGLAFSPDGGKLYTVSYSTSTNLRQFNLSNPYDLVSEYEYVGGFSVGNNGSGNMVFTPDGKKIISCSYSGTVLGVAELDVPWELTTVVTSSITRISSSSDNVNIRPATSTGSFYINDTGTKFFISGRTNVIREFMFTEPYDINSLIFVEDHIMPFSKIHGITFANNGNILYISHRESRGIRSIFLNSSYKPNTYNNDWSNEENIRTFPIDTYNILFTHNNQRLWIGGGSGSSAPILELRTGL